MGQRQLQFRINVDVLETSDKLQKLALEEEGLIFFTLQAKSVNAWNSYVFQMGLTKIKQDFDKFLKMQEETENEA